ncbi:MAG: hypothetical protein IPO21_01540 [Bacteroidales bacterium]|nr:hypothetical protein [Bacteroidales bacterium]
MSLTLDSKELLKKALDHILYYLEIGKINEARKYYDFIIAFTSQFPEALWTDVEIWKLGKVLLVVYHSDVVDNEDENIKFAHLSFFYLHRSLELSEQKGLTENDSFVIYKTAATLLKSCEDCFYSTLTNLYLPKKCKDEKYIETAETFAKYLMPLIRYTVLLDLEKEVGSFHDDEFLEELCYEIEELYPDMSEKELNEARKMRKLLYNFIRYKVSEGELYF